jgi:adenine phosphoribosyltransferase
MKNSVIIEVQSITTVQKQILVLDKIDLEYMNGKRILILGFYFNILYFFVDDVISTGKSLLALEQLAKKSTGTIVAKAAGFFFFFLFQN